MGREGRRAACGSRGLAAQLEAEPGRKREALDREGKRGKFC